MSDKTTAALAAEQADVEATTTQEPELLPAATLDELEQVDLGTVTEGERAPFRITDDRCADWAIRKIADERSEYNRLKALADEQIAAAAEVQGLARLHFGGVFHLVLLSAKKRCPPSSMTKIWLSWKSLVTRAGL